MILTLGSAAIPACVTRGEFNKEQQARRAAEEQRDGLERHVTELQEERRRLAAELDRLRTQVQDQLKVASEAGLDRARYREKLDELERRLAALGEAASAEGHSGDVTVFQTAEGTVVEIKEGILFDSGKKDIKAKGKEILDRVAAEIARTEYKLRVEGHTDADPVKVHAKEYPHGNLQLSAERAVEVASYLTGGSKSAIDEGRVSVAGYGPNRPKSTDKSTEGKRQNRRVDIVILNASMGVIDAASVTKPAEEGK
jgi:flagellar motor protein MotB